MREFNFGDKKPVEIITNELWSIFDILRSEPVSSSDYQLILFLLSLYNEGYLTEELLQQSDEVKYSIEKSIRSATSGNSQQYLEIYRAFEPTFKQLSNRGLSLIVQVLTRLDLEELNLHFSEVFDKVLYRIAKSQGRQGGEFIQPIELSRLVIRLADLKPNSSVYNPFAGVASFGVFLDKKQSYLGQEVNYMTWAIGALRLLAHKRNSNTYFVNENSILNWVPDNEKFDLVVANPPFRMRLDNSNSQGFQGYRIIEQFLIDKGLSSINRTGKFIAILPAGFLFSGGAFQHLREYLLEQDYIETVISLPGGLLMNTGLQLAILVLNKAKERPGYITRVDAKDYVEGKGTRERKLNDEALYSDLKKGIDNNSIRIVENERVRKLGYNLSVPRYFQKDFDGVRLSSILEYVRGYRGENITEGKLVRIRDLKDDKLEYFLDESLLEESPITRPDVRILEESSLLLAIRWKTLKPTYFRYTGTPILLPNDIIALKVNDAEVNIGYLVNELHADYVDEQISAYRIGETIPFIRRDDLLAVKIKLPGLSEQAAKIQGIEELSNKIKSLQQERNALVHGKSNSRFNEFASLKHTLGRPRQNILDWSDNLLHFLSSKAKEIKTLNEAFAGFYDLDMISALNEIKRDVNFMSEVLEKGENGLIVENYALELLPLSDMNALINGITHNGFKFKIKKIPIKGEKLKDRGIECNPILLKTLIDNVLTNADKHGFTKKDAANELVIELTELEDQLILEIKNNGKPFSKNFDKEKFISKYSTANPQSGSGLGGYDINRIAEHFNNPTWELILNEDPIYPVKFKFQFLLKFLK